MSELCGATYELRRGHNLVCGLPPHAEGEHVDQATRKAWTSASAGMLHDINTLTADEMRLSLVLLAGYSPDGVLAALAMIEDERARAEPAAPDNTTDQPAGGAR